MSQNSHGLPTGVVAAVVAKQSPEVLSLVSQYSCLSKLVHITIYILRFIRRSLQNTLLLNKVSPAIKDFLLVDNSVIIGQEVRLAKIV